MAGRGRPFVVVWREEDTEEALRAAYRGEQRADVRQRLQALGLLRSGEGRLAEVAAVLGVEDRTVQRWVAWYRRVDWQRCGGSVGGLWADAPPDAGAAGAARAGSGDRAMPIMRRGLSWGYPCGSDCSRSRRPAADQQARLWTWGRSLVSAV